MIIGVAGEIGHGKDTVAQAITYLTSDARHSLSFINFIAADASYRTWRSPWETRRFAGKLKQVIALYLGCTVEQLEDREFKDKPLGPEWIKYIVAVEFIHNDARNGQIIHIDQMFATEREATEYAQEQVFYGFREHLTMFDNYISYDVIKQELTPRLFMQYLGTQGMRDVIHPNIHVNGLLADYKPVGALRGSNKDVLMYPYWIVPDTRFPNEADAIKDKDGLVFKVFNPRITTKSKHASERALDGYKNFDLVINNGGSLDDLLVDVEYALKVNRLL